MCFHLKVPYMFWSMEHVELEITFLLAEIALHDFLKSSVKLSEFYPNRMRRLSPLLWKN